jgi:hypothetical protein
MREIKKNKKVWPRWLLSMPTAMQRLKREEKRGCVP